MLKAKSLPSLVLAFLFFVLPAVAAETGQPAHQQVDILPRLQMNAMEMGQGALGEGEPPVEGLVNLDIQLEVVATASMPIHQTKAGYMLAGGSYEYALLTVTNTSLPGLNVEVPGTFTGALTLAFAWDETEPLPLGIQLKLLSVLEGETHSPLGAGETRTLQVVYVQDEAFPAEDFMFEDPQTPFPFTILGLDITPCYTVGLTEGQEEIPPYRGEITVSPAPAE